MHYEVEVRVSLGIDINSGCIFNSIELAWSDNQANPASYIFATILTIAADYQTVTHTTAHTATA